MQLDIIGRAERAFGDFTLLEFKSQGSALAKQLRLGASPRVKITAPVD
jgi:hypothetical protein